MNNPQLNEAARANCVLNTVSLMVVLVFAAIAIILACVVLLIGEVRSYLATARNKQPEALALTLSRARK